MVEARRKGGGLGRKEYSIVILICWCENGITLCYAMCLYVHIGLADWPTGAKHYLFSFMKHSSSTSSLRPPFLSAADLFVHLLYRTVMLSLPIRRSAHLTEDRWLIDLEFVRSI